MTEQESWRAHCMGGFQHHQSRRTREHAVWVDSNIDGAGEQESMLYGWIPTSTEQENKRACCMGGFQHRRSRRTREHAVWVDFNITRAGEQESMLYGWIPTSTEQENECMLYGWISTLMEQESQRTGLHHGSCWGIGVLTQTFNNAVHILPPTLREGGSVFVQVQRGWSAARNAGNRCSFWQYYKPKKTKEILGGL